MTDYIKQVAEAVRNEAWRLLSLGEHECHLDDTEIDAIIAQVPKPEPVAWFAFADNNGPVPLELYGWDEKACKYAVLKHAHSEGWKGTLEGYLMHVRWGINPLYTYPLDEQAEIDRLNAELQETKNTAQEHVASTLELLMVRQEVSELKAEAEQREGFIEKLLAQRHAELKRAIELTQRELGCHPSFETVDTVVAQIEEERGNYEI